VLGPLKEVRIGRLSLAGLACVSGAATALILTGGSNASTAQLAALAALRDGRTVIEQAPASTSQSTGSAPAASVATPANSSGGAPSSAPTAASSADSSTGDDTTTPTTTTTTTDTTSTTTTTATDAGLPHVGHVFLIALSTRSFAEAFGRGSQAPYLRKLAKHGALLTGFHSLGRAELPDLLAMVSGQAPNRSTEGNCSRYVPFPAKAAADSAGVVGGHGCVYPDTALTIADQSTSAGKTWGAYISDSGATNCPVPNTDAALSTPLGGTTEGYDLLHNPFAFFGSLLDAGACSSDDQNLTALPAALRRASRTPAFTYLGADACTDGAPQMAAAQPATPATTTASGTTGATGATGATSPAGTSSRIAAPASVGCPAGSPSGIVAENAFLKTWVPQILESQAYRKNGVVVIAFTGDGGRPKARTGALVLSRWTRHRTTVRGSYGPYSLLHSLEQMLDYQPLAHAAAAPSFAKAVLGG
jgi:phosphatidylinositol-3-phosphatase